ncbi:MAG: hypothetical protein DIU80_015265 [Chloroflexota bacterium]|nr:MAG: hypothetical protein DIU80_22170 [Chloroflexota bacterium]
MEWEHRICPDRACSAVWFVASDSRGYDVWYVAREAGAQPTVVAASGPVCPICGEELVTILELEGGLGPSGLPESGPLFDYARTL